MRGLPAIIALTLKCVGAASVAAAQPVCVSCSPSATAMDRRDSFVLAMGGGDGGIHFGGGMHCGPGCAGGGGGMGGGAGGGMGASSGGMGAGAFGGWDPFLRVPRANCPQDRQKSDRRHTRPNSRETELSHCPNGR